MVFALASVLALALLLGALALTHPGPPYDVRGKAEVPYDAGPVKEVRVLGSVTVYVDGEPKPSLSTLGGIGLIVLATAALMTAFVLRLGTPQRRLVAFYLIAGAALAYAGLDELFAIHETIGHNLRFLADVPGVSRPDDLIIALYVVPAAVFAFVFRDVLLGNRPAALALGAGICLFALSAAGDLTGQKTIEEYFELFSGLCIATGLGLLMHAHLRRNLRPQAEMPDEVTVVDQRTQPRVPAGSGG